MKRIKSVIFKDIVVLTEVVSVSPGEIKDVQVPDSVPVDLQAKLIVCLIHMHISAPLEVNDSQSRCSSTDPLHHCQVLQLKKFSSGELR